MYKTPPKTPSQYPSRSESDLRKLHAVEDLEVNITQRAKRRCLSEEVSGGELDLFKNEFKQMIHDMFTTQNCRLDKLENHIMEIKNHYTEIRSTNTELEKAMTVISDQLQSLEDKIITLEKERGSMTVKLSTLEEKIESFDRSLIKTSIELRNVPKRVNETKTMLYDVVTHLSNHLGIETDLTSVRDVARQPSKKENTTSSLTVEFSNTLTKTRFLTAVKDYNKKNPKGKVNSSHLNIKTAQITPIYIAEQLTSYSKRLFYLSRNFAKSHNYNFCWTSGGRVLLKKDSDSQSFVIKNEEQLRQLPPNNTA